MKKNQSTQTESAGFEITSRRIKEVYEEIHDYAVQGRPCIFFGPTGAGKEFAAQYYYNILKNSKPNALFKSLNCAGLTETLAVSELFGHVPKAFNEAVEKKGLFEEANNGILFLDEIGDIPVSVQAMLLRAVDPGTYEARRLGSNKNYSTKDVIVICATDQPRSKLREALLNRLGHQVFIPGVDERIDDLPPAVEFFINAALQKRRDVNEIIKLYFNKNDNRKVKELGDRNPLDYLSERISTRLLPLIEKKTWPGNFREIRNAVDTAVIRAKKVKEVEKFVNATVQYYNSHLKTIKIIEDYGHSVDQSTGNNALVNQDVGLVYDEKMLENIRKALPKLDEDELKKWASFFYRIGTRPFYRKELDQLIPKGPRTLNYRLEALEKDGLLARTERDKYVLNSDKPETLKEKTVDETVFPLPKLDFTPTERGDEINNVVDMLENTRGLFISGETQSGKTTFVFMLGQKLLQKGWPVFYHAFDESRLVELLQLIREKLQSQEGLKIPPRTTESENELPLFAASLTGYLNTLFSPDAHPVLILDNADKLRSETDIKTLNVMLQQWLAFTFVLVGKKLGNELKIKEDIAMVEYKMKTFNS